MLLDAHSLLKVESAYTAKLSELEARLLALVSAGTPSDADAQAVVVWSATNPPNDAALKAALRS